MKVASNAFEVQVLEDKRCDVRVIDLMPARIQRAPFGGVVTPTRTMRSNGFFNNSVGVGFFITGI